jgi:receptor expression-enhancing protein 1/2/3/4
VHPFLEKNEIAIDDFISSAHDRVKAAGATYLKHGIELIKQYIFGLPPKEPTPPPTPTTFSYTQSLIARFNLPAARPSLPANPITSATSTANDFYSLLASAVSAATSSPAATAGKPRDLSNSGILVPPTVEGEDRLSFISAQRERLAILLSALDKEASTLQGKSAPRVNSRMFNDGNADTEDEGAERPKSAMSGLSTRKSEVDFEKIDAESGTEEMMSGRTPKAGGGSWLPWSWGAKPESTKSDLTSVDTVMSGTAQEEDKGKSSSIET